MMLTRTPPQPVSAANPLKHPEPRVFLLIRDWSSGWVLGLRSMTGFVIISLVLEESAVDVMVFGGDIGMFDFFARMFKHG
jgi:hypothetical protein